MHTYIFFLVDSVQGLFTKDSMVTSNAILTENQKSELRPPYENPQPCAMPPDATPPVSSAGACALVVPLAPVYSSSPAPPWLLHESPKPPTRSVNIAVPLKAPLIRPSPLADPLPLARESGAVVGVTQQQSCDVGLQTALSQNSKVWLIKLWDIWKSANELMEVVLEQVSFGERGGK